MNLDARVPAGSPERLRLVSSGEFSPLCLICKVGHYGPRAHDGGEGGSTALNLPVCQSTDTYHGTFLGTGNTVKVRDWQTVSAKGRQ